LRVLGYQTPQFLLMVLTENALLLLCGLVTGVLCALIAIEPALGSQGGHLPAAAATVLLAAILGLGILISVIATRVAVRGAVLAALRSE